MKRRAFLASLLIAITLFLVASAYPLRAAQAPHTEDQLLQLVRTWLDAAF